MKLTKETKAMLAEWLEHMELRVPRRKNRPRSFYAWEEGVSLGYKDARDILALQDPEMIDSKDYRTRLIKKSNDLENFFMEKKRNGIYLLLLQAEIMTLRMVIAYIEAIEETEGIEV